MFKGDEENASSNTQTSIQLKSAPRGRKDRNVVVLEKIETEGDRQLKSLAGKQINVKTTLREQLSKRKAFTTPTVFESPAAYGHTTLPEYRRLVLLEQRKEELRTYHLNSEEIQLVLEHEQLFQDEPHQKRAKYGIDPQIQEEKIKNIYDKIRIKDMHLAKRDEFKGVKKLSRHGMDLEKAIASRNKETTALSNMLLGSANNYTDISKPESDITSLLKDLEHRVYRTGSQNSVNTTDSDMSAKDTKSISSDTSVCVECEKLRLKDRGTVGPLLKAELTDFEFCEKCRQKNQPTTFNQATSDSERMEIEDTLVNDCAASIEKKVVLSCEDSVPEEVIKKYRLSMEEIRELPRFKNYAPGEPNKTLYLKNLSSKVTEEDLPALFIRFQDSESPKVVFKLLKGKMRGQAFVTFPNEETATAALELINGYNFKGKPIIIQYAKKH